MYDNRLNSFQDNCLDISKRYLLPLYETVVEGIILGKKPFLFQKITHLLSSSSLPPGVQKVIAILTSTLPFLIISLTLPPLFAWPLYITIITARMASSDHIKEFTLEDILIGPSLISITKAALYGISYTSAIAITIDLFILYKLDFLSHLNQARIEITKYFSKETKTTFPQEQQSNEISHREEKLSLNHMSKKNGMRRSI